MNVSLDCIDEHFELKPGFLCIEIVGTWWHRKPMWGHILILLFSCLYFVIGTVSAVLKCKSKYWNRNNVWYFLTTLHYIRKNRQSEKYLEGITLYSLDTRKLPVYHVSSFHHEQINHDDILTKPMINYTLWNLQQRTWAFIIMNNSNSFFLWWVQRIFGGDTYCMYGY